MKSIISLLILCFRYLPYKYKIHGVVIIILIFISTIVDLLGVATIFPLFSMYLSDEIFSNKYFLMLIDVTGLTEKNDLLYFLIGVVTISLLLKTCFITFSNYLQGKYIYNVYSYLVELKYDNIFSENVNTEQINSDELKSDIYILPRVFSNQLLISLFNFIAEGFILILILLLLLIYNWSVMLVLVLTMLPLFSLFFLTARNLINTLDKKIKEFIAKIARSVSIAHFGRIDIKLSNSFGYFKRKFNNLIKDESSLLTSKLVLSKIPVSVVELSVLFSFLVLILFNVSQGNSKEELLLQVSIFGVAALKLMPSINRIMFSIMNIKSNFYCTEILFTPQLVLPDVKASKLNFEESISLHSIHFKYKNKAEVLAGLDLHINKSQRVGIVGESGTGKSTLFKLLLGELTPQQGEIMVDSLKINDSNKGSWVSLIGMVSQDVYILDGNLKENIAFGIEKVDEEKLNDAIEQSALSDFVASLPNGVETNLGEMGAMISGGQKQRIGIARALYKGAKVLLFDEATSALDEKTESMVKKSIQNLSKELIIIAISHKKDFLDFCDKVYEMKNGKLKEILIDKN